MIEKRSIGQLVINAEGGVVNAYLVKPDGGQAIWIASVARGAMQKIDGLPQKFEEFCLFTVKNVVVETVGYIPESSEPIELSDMSDEEKKVLHDAIKKRDTK